MKTILYAVVAVVLAFAAGFAAGHHWDSVSVKAGQTTAAHAETKSVVDGVNKQAAAQHADAVKEQGFSLALAAQKDGIVTNGFNLQSEIDHAQFLPKPAPKPQPSSIVVSCDDDDPVSSPDFIGLYNRAARGTDPAAAATTATGRVH